MGLGHGRCNLGFIKKPMVPDIVAELAILSVFLVALDKLSTRRRAFGLVLAGRMESFPFPMYFQSDHALPRSNSGFEASLIWPSRLSPPSLCAGNSSGRDCCV